LLSIPLFNITLYVDITVLRNKPRKRRDFPSRRRRRSC